MSYSYKCTDCDMLCVYTHSHPPLVPQNTVLEGLSADPAAPVQQSRNTDASHSAKQVLITGTDYM